MHRTFSPRVIRQEGGFAGLFRLDFDGKLFARNYTEPVLVSGTDGVGTKLVIAQQTGRARHRWHRPGGDVRQRFACAPVANRCFFSTTWRWVATIPSGWTIDRARNRDGCLRRTCHCSVGKPPSCPIVIGEDDYDLAGFAVGVVERRRLIDGKLIGKGDVVLGLAASGLHSNGFSLVRKVIKDAGLTWDDQPDDFGGRSLADVCFEPTRIYTSVIRAVQSHYRVKQVIHGLAHITGGGIEENLDRVLPGDVDAEIDASAWQPPTVYRWLQQSGGIATAELRRVFNMGIGMALIVSNYYAQHILRMLSEHGLRHLADWPSR